MKNFAIMVGGWLLVIIVYGSIGVMIAWGS